MSSQMIERIVIEFLYLDLTTCTRCIGTGESLETALDMVGGVLAATGAQVEVHKTLVETMTQARESRFVSSPTIRVNGRDIALELKESPCASEPCGCDCHDDTLCRVWSYRGQDHAEAPVGLIVDAILGEVHGGPPRAQAVNYELLANLQDFFARKADANACCSPEQQESCCAPSEKSDCCGPSIVRRCGCL